MPTAEQLVELVVFRESGLTDIAARTTAFAEEVEKTRRRVGGLADALNDPAFARHATQMRELTRTEERLAQAIKNRGRAADLASGSFSRHAAAMAQLNVQARRLDNQERLASLVAVHGRFGGVIRHNTAELTLLGRTALGTVGAVAALGIGMARSGLQGTVEGYRLEMQWTRLSRQLAAIAIPAVEKLANWVGRLADWFQGLSGSEQNALLRLGLFTAGVVTLGGALRGLVMVGGAVAGIFRTIGATAGMAAGGGGVAGLAGAAGGVGGAGVAATGVGLGEAAAVGGTAALARPSAALRYGLPMAAGAIAKEAGVGDYVLGGALGVGAIRGAVGSIGPMGAASTPGMIGGALKGAGRLAWPLAVGMSLWEGATGGHYSLARERGQGQTSAAMTAVGMGALNTLTFGYGADWFGYTSEARDAAAKRAAGGHQDVTPLQVAQEEAGGAHFRIQEEFLKVSEARAESEKSLKESIDDLTKAIEQQAESVAPSDGSPSGAFLGSTNAQQAYADYLRMIADQTRRSTGR